MAVYVYLWRHTIHLKEIDYFIASLKTIISGESKPDTKSLAQQVIPTSELNSDDIINQFAKAAGWHNRHREIMLLSKQLPPIREGFA